MCFYQESIETMDYTRLKSMQNELFCDLIKRVYKSVDYYKEKIEELGIDPLNLPVLQGCQKSTYSYNLFLLKVG